MYNSLYILLYMHGAESPAVCRCRRCRRCCWCRQRYVYKIAARETGAGMAGRPACLPSSLPIVSAPIRFMVPAWAPRVHSTRKRVDSSYATLSSPDLATERASEPVLCSFVHSFVWFGPMCSQQATNARAHAEQAANVVVVRRFLCSNSPTHIHTHTNTRAA